MHQSDNELVEWLVDCDASLLVLLMSKMYTPLSIDVWGYKKVTVSDIPSQGSHDRVKLCREVVRKLSYFGSHNVAYYARNIADCEPGVSYKRMLIDVGTWLEPKESVVKSIRQKLFEEKPSKEKTTIPKYGTVAEYEEWICVKLLCLHLKDKSIEELINMFNEQNIPEGIKKIYIIRDILRKGTVGGAIVKLVKVLGRETVERIIIEAAQWAITKMIGKEAASIFVTELGKKIGGRVVTALNVVGWGLIVWDIVKIGDPAKRILIPSICLIACMRTVERFNNPNNKAQVG